MKNIKTRNTVKAIKILDKSVNLSMRMKGTFVRTKESAEETKEPRSSTPTEYASGKAEETVRGAARNTARNLPDPRQRARENFNHAKNHFQEVRRQLPKERRRAAEQARKAAYKIETESKSLIKTADKANETAIEAKKAVKEAKQTLREVRRQGRRTLREVKQKVKYRPEREIKTFTSDAPKAEMPCPSQARQYGVKKIRAVKTNNAPKIKLFRREPGVTDSAPAIGDKPSYKLKAINRAKGGIPKNEPIITRDSTKFVNPVNSKMETPRLYDHAASAAPSSGVKPPDNPKAVNPASAKREMPRPGAERAAKPSGGKAAGQPKNASPVNGGVFKHDYVGKGTKAPQASAGEASTPLKTPRMSVKSGGKAAESTAKEFKKTAKGTVKEVRKSVKTAEQAAKQAVKTAKRTAKTTRKTAQASMKTAKIAERTARAAAKTAARTAKAAAKAAVAMVKAAISAVKGLIAIIAAGGWAAVAIILIICVIGLIAGSAFGIFFSGEPDPGTGKTVNSVITEINTEYTAEIDGIISANPYDLLDMSGARAAWKDVLAVYTVKTTTDPDNPMETATMNDAKAAILRSVFWEMNAVTHTAESAEVIEDVLDEDGLPTCETTSVTKNVLRIAVSHKTPDEMAALYGFTAKQTELMNELLEPDYYALWNGLLYGVASVGDGTMLEIADTQIGNIGGEPYWSWYGFESRVEWCACFVSWVAEQCGYLEAGIIPKFSLCESGMAWFKDNGQWQERGYVPSPGDIVFFNWDDNPDSDHVGIVERVEGDYVHTVEGNTSDSCARRSYRLDYSCIMGYGVPTYE